MLRTVCMEVCQSFQSTLPRRERLRLLLPYKRTNPFQSTLPRRERPKDSYSFNLSFHFNPRSHEGSDATEFATDKIPDNFNPRSHEGSDRSVSPFTIASKGFQSTLPRRERLFWPDNILSISTISIHAPTKGATMLQIAYSEVCQLFQSTLPRRERRPLFTSVDQTEDFNPRSHEGSDLPHQEQ